MGTISQKIEYLNETKQRQKTLINALGGNITNDTPFREYEKELVGVLPKVTGEGTNISLSPTIEYDLEVESYKGDTYQATLTGKNLWEFENTITGNGNRTRTLTTPLPAGTYTFSFYALNSSGKAIDIYSGSTKVKNCYIAIHTTSTRVYYTFTASDVITSFNIYSGGADDVLSDFQLETGSSMTSYEPYCGGIPSPNPRISSRYTSSYRNTRSRSMWCKFTKCNSII